MHLVQPALPQHSFLAPSQVLDAHFFPAIGQVQLESATIERPAMSVRTDFMMVVMMLGKGCSILRRRAVEKHAARRGILAKGRRFATAISLSRQP